MSNSASDIPVREYENVGAGQSAGAYVGSALEEALESNPDWAPVDERSLPVDEQNGESETPVEPEVPEAPQEPEAPVEPPSEDGESADGEGAEGPNLDDLDRQELNELAEQVGVEDAEQLPDEDAVKAAIQAILDAPADEQNGEG